MLDVRIERSETSYDPRLTGEELSYLEKRNCHQILDYSGFLDHLIGDLKNENAKHVSKEFNYKSNAISKDS